MIQPYPQALPPARYPSSMLSRPQAWASTSPACPATTPKVESAPPTPGPPPHPHPLAHHLIAHAHMRPRFPPCR
eukprot:scaffold2386_cov21-Tisochrysis_lutea.AAC.1